MLDIRLILRNFIWKWGEFNWADRSIIFLRLFTLLGVLNLLLPLNFLDINSIVFHTKQQVTADYRLYLIFWLLYTIIFLILLYISIDKRSFFVNISFLGIKTKTNKKGYALKNIIYLVSMLIDGGFVWWLMENTGGKSSPNFVFLFLLVAFHSYYWMRIVKLNGLIIVLSSLLFLFIRLNGNWSSNTTFNFGLLCMVGLSTSLLRRRDRKGYIRAIELQDRLKVGTDIRLPVKKIDNIQLISDFMNDVYAKFRPQYTEMYLYNNEGLLERVYSISTNLITGEYFYSEPEQGKFLNAEKCLIGKCFLEQKSLIINKFISKKEIWQEFPEINESIAVNYQEFLKSDMYFIMIVPLFILDGTKNQKMGVIRLINRMPLLDKKYKYKAKLSYESYRKDEQQALEVIAKLLAFRLRNNELIKRIEHRKDKLFGQKHELEEKTKQLNVHAILKETMVRIIAAAQADDIDSALRLICEEFQNLTRAKKSSLWLHEGKYLILRYANNLDPVSNEEKTVLEENDSFVGTVIKTKKVQILSNPTKSKKFQWKKTACDQVVVVGVPLGNDETEVLGVLCTHPIKREYLTEQVQLALQELSSLAGFVLKFLFLRDAQAKTSLFRQSIAELIKLRENEKSTFNKEVVFRVKESLQVEAASMFSVDVKGDYSLVLEASTDNSKKEMIGYRVYDYGEGLTGETARSRKSKISYNVLQDPGRSANFEEATESIRRSYISVPIFDRENDVSHVLRCINKMPSVSVYNTFTSYDLELLEHFADLISIFNDHYRTSEERIHFMKTILHEALSPINHILGAAEYLENKYMQKEMYPEKVKGYLRDIITECHLLTAVLGGPSVEYLTAIDFNYGYYDIKDIIDPCIHHLKEYRPYQAKKYLFCEIQEVPPVKIDYDRTVQVVMNILLNASKYSPPDGKILIDIRLIEEFPTEYVYVKFSNHGQGIPEGWEEYIFDRFTRPPISQKKYPEGTGYGLFVAKTIMQLQGGDIRLVNKENPVAFALLFDATQKGY